MRSSDKYVTVNEVAEELNYTVQHTRLLIRQGKIEAEKLGRDWLVLRETVETYKVDRKSRTPSD